MSDHSEADAIESVIAKVITRLNRLFFTKTGVLKKSPHVLKAAGNVLFLVSTLPIPKWKESKILSEPLQTFLGCFWRNVDKTADIADSMVIACHRLDWKPSGYNDIPRTNIGIDHTLCKVSGYHAVMNLYCRQYIIDAAADPEHTSTEAGYMMLEGFNACLEYIDVDVDFQGKFVKQDDDNLYKIYFVTHVVFVLTGYGVCPTSECIPEKGDRVSFVRVLRRWYNQIVEHDAIWPNLELFIEICICLIYFRESIPEGKKLYKSLLQLGSENQFHLAALQVGSKQNVFFPPINSKSPEFLTDYHTHVLVALFLSLGVE